MWHPPGAAMADHIDEWGDAGWGPPATADDVDEGWGHPATADDVDDGWVARVAPFGLTGHDGRLPRRIVTDRDAILAAVDGVIVELEHREQAR